MVKVYICKICGDAYIADNPPPRCPFCGAYPQYLTELNGFKPNYDVELNEIDRKNAEHALEVEVSNTMFYKCAGAKSNTFEGQKIFKYLKKVEEEHAMVWKKILKLDTVDFPENNQCAVETKANLQESHKREERAINFYKKAAAEATNPRVKEIFSAFVEVETDHLDVSEKRLK